MFFAWQTQSHLKFHGFAATVVSLAAWWLKLGALQWLALIFAVGFVVVAEIVNTAIELVVDLAEPHFHPLAGRAKDVAAGAVLYAAIQAIVIGLIVFLPPIWQFLR